MSLKGSKTEENLKAALLESPKQIEGISILLKKLMLKATTM